MSNKVEYERLNGEHLCFNHAVKAVIEKGEVITAHVPDNIDDYDMGGTGYFSSPCVECFPEERVKEDDD